MELKLEEQVAAQMAALDFKSHHFGIETTLYHICVWYHFHTLNRTILELKRELVGQVALDFGHFKSHHFGIETDCEDT